MRKSLYISERLDRDLIEYMETNSFYDDFAREVKNLMRDGIKYRRGGNDETKIRTQERQVREDTIHNRDVPSNQQAKPKSVMDNKGSTIPKIDFSDIKTERKEVGLDELDSRLNAL